MAVEGGAKCIKYLLFFFNFIFWLCGLALIVVGVMAKVSINTTAFLQGYSGSPLVIIIVGVIIFFIAFFGCCGAWKENQCMVTMFAVILSLIVIVEIGAAIAGYVLRGNLTELLNKGFDSMIAGYNETENREAMDGIQRDLKCCGRNSSSDWMNSKFLAANSVPDSCCKNITRDCGKGALQQTTKIYTDGCQPILDKLLKQNILWIAVAALVIAFVQISGIVLSCILMRAIRSGYEVM
ncbi:CD63 antigen-like [Carassius carassius]|uniref:CD63 antigen-like n=1 Tax=Carassius carassius TaxID=217509 RepID=UPI002868EB4C|nr:CD63 antigen-like [Carassius carassius]XP_059384144.1 CD63 antigen-like [Carassius carassius]